MPTRRQQALLLVQHRQLPTLRQPQLLVQHRQLLTRGQFLPPGLRWAVPTQRQPALLLVQHLPVLTVRPPPRGGPTPRPPIRRTPPLHPSAGRRLALT